MASIKRIVFDCGVITPLFMGGATQQPEIRTQSFNGLFRYWFRFLGGKFDDEKKLFGWGGEDANKGKVRLFVDIADANISKTYDLQGQGINYLGFSMKMSRRRYITPNSTFKLHITFHPTLKDEDIKKFLSAVWCAFYLGNFGSRSRRGFGSIVIEKVDNDLNFLKFKPEGNISEWIKENLRRIKSSNRWDRRDNLPWVFEDLEIYKVERGNWRNYERWIRDVQRERSGRRIVTRWNLNTVSNINDLLDFMGFLLAAYRSYYQPDYKTAKNILRGSSGNISSRVIEKISFGLPLNFYFSSIRRGNMVVPVLYGNRLRRSSPLILKVISYGNNFEGFFIRFKEGNWKFLPNNASLILGKTVLSLPTPVLKSVNDFITTLQSNNIIIKVWP